MKGSSPSRVRLLWLMLPDQRPYRELYWLSRMRSVEVTAVGERPPAEDVAFVRRPYRRLTRRFVEAGTLAWLRHLDSIPEDADWVASLEFCSLVSGQASGLARRRGARQVVLTWANDPENPLYRIPPYRWAARRAFQADLALCLIRAAVDHCVALGIPAERCAVVHPGVDTRLFTPAPAPPEDPVATFVSSLEPNKGIDRVIAAFDLARRFVPEARLRVVGGGPMARVVRRRMDRGDRAVELVGPLDRQGVASVLRASSVFITAPRPTRVWNEQFGLAYLEAMASGLPVVTTRCGTNHEAVPPPNLLLPDDAEALAEGLVSFLGDAERRDVVGRANRRYVQEHHDLERQIGRMEETLLAVHARSV